MPDRSDRRRRRRCCGRTPWSPFARGLSDHPDTDFASLFVDGVLTADAVGVDCPFENGNETTCTQLEVSSLPPGAQLASALSVLADADFDDRSAAWH